MYGEGCVRIERISNGYTVKMRDPKIVEANQKREVKSDYRAPYIDPDREYAFDKLADVLDFLKKNLDKALPATDFASAFDSLTTSGDSSDDGDD